MLQIALVDDWSPLLSGPPFTLHPSLELAVCPHIHHALLAEEEEVVAVCIRINSKFPTDMFDVILVGHLDFEI